MDGLIVTADDFGLSVEVNEAVEIAHRNGILTAASLMVSGPAAADAVRRARALPDLRIGLHLVMVEGAPTLPAEKIPTLVGESGALRADMTRLAFDLALRASARRQLSAEISAQFAAYAATGLKLDHVNAHKHFHLHPLVAGKILSIGRAFGLRTLRAPAEKQSVLRKLEPNIRTTQLLTPWVGLLRQQARWRGVKCPDWVFGLEWSGAMTLERILGLLANLPPGVVEVYTHPATGAGFAGRAPGYRYAEELAALCHPACREAVVRSGRPIGGYSDFLN